MIPRFALLLALLGPLTAEAARVAVVSSDDMEPYTAPVRAFTEAIGEPVDVYNLRGREVDAENLAKRLAQRPPSVVFALGAKAAWVLRKRLPQVPVIYAAILSPGRFDIEGTGTVGVSTTAPPERTISQLASFFPDLRRVAVLRGPSIPDQRMRQMQEAAALVGLEIVDHRVRTPKDVRAAYGQLSGQVDALWVQADREVLDRPTYRFAVEESQRLRLPLVVETENMVRAGGLFAVVPDPDGVGRRAAAIALDILGGAGADGRTEYVDDVDVVVNLSTVAATRTAFDRLMLDFVDIVVE
jgi:putative ABC transport system substrate-binding protein